MIKFLRNHTWRFAVLSAIAAFGVTNASAQASHPFGQSQPIAGSYIVVFKDSVANPGAEAASLVRANGGQLRHTYSTAVKGFAASMPDAAVRGLRNHPSIDYIEQDQTVSLAVTTLQDGATWGLSRIDQVDLPVNTQYEYGKTGAGVNAYIIDTGVRQDHVDFGARVGTGFNAVLDSNGTNDCNGHGTHVAGTVGGTQWGVAKQVNLIPVRVLNCAGSGTNSGVIAGIDWVANNRVLPAVANMSLGGSFSAAINTAVAGAVAKGVTMVVAAGNSNANACNSSPASEPSAITVGATTNLDARASYSNYGTCVDIFAPGSSITSAWYTTTVATNTISGTSMASPHVTGVAALVAEANPGASPAAIAYFIKTRASLNKVTSPGTGSPNLLLFSLGTGLATEPPKPVVAVKSLVPSTSKVARNWRAVVTVTIRDIEFLTLMPNVTVSGTFAPGGAASCVTTSSGTCTMTSATITYSSTGGNTSLFQITNVAGTGVIYNSAANSASAVTVNYKP